MTSFYVGSEDCMMTYADSKQIKLEDDLRYEQESIVNTHYRWQSRDTKVKKRGQRKWHRKQMRRLQNLNLGA